MLPESTGSDRYAYGNNGIDRKERRHRVNRNESMYKRIYSTVSMVPPGKVATYGQIARIAGRCSARNVGYAMSSVPPGSYVPWHRVINSRGSISVRSHGEECVAQRQMLESEGIVFSSKGTVDLDRFGWQEPQPDRGSYGR
jgi:methylated-DNA-protein-cysteine methyltransferase-like protein